MTKQVDVLCSNPPGFHFRIFILTSVLNVNLGVLHSTSNSIKLLSFSESVSNQVPVISDYWLNTFSFSFNLL